MKLIQRLSRHLKQSAGNTSKAVWPAAPNLLGNLKSFSYRVTSSMNWIGVTHQLSLPMQSLGRAQCCETLPNEHCGFDGAPCCYSLSGKCQLMTQLCWKPSMC